jgi:hypothetical protein
MFAASAGGGALTDRNSERARSQPEWLTDPLLRNVYETVSGRGAPAVTYDNWLDYWFGGAADGRPGGIPIDPLIANGHALRMFTHAREDLGYFSDEEIGGGLWPLIGDDEIYLTWPDISVEQRESCLFAMTDLFRDLFAVRCKPILSHRATSDDHPGALNTACYMWWEFTTHIAWPGDPARERMFEAMWRVMEETLDIPHVAVQESALHGLGHATHVDHPRVEAIIDRWTARHHDLDEGLAAYARAARSGCIQ